MIGILCSLWMPEFFRGKPEIITVWTLLAVLMVTNGAYINSYDGPLLFQCPSGKQAINRVKSVHNNRAEDRMFDLSCADVWTEKTADCPVCFWTDFQNEYDKLLHYLCPANQYISGMYSIHRNRQEDRIWRLYCCSLASLKLVGCTTSGWTNGFDRAQDFTVPTGKVMTGVISEHNNRAEDRRYEYTYCDIARVDD